MLLASVPGQVLEKATAKHPFAIASPQTTLVLALRLASGDSVPSVRESVFL